MTVLHNEIEAKGATVPPLGPVVLDPPNTPSPLPFVNDFPHLSQAFGQPHRA